MNKLFLLVLNFQKITNNYFCTDPDEDWRCHIVRRPSVRERVRSDLSPKPGNNIHWYSVFQGFSKAKSANGGSILSSNQFLILPQLPQKIKLASKVVKVDSKIIISLPQI